jgi:geranylgeranyl pyrophosphate synthase
MDFQTKNADYIARIEAGIDTLLPQGDTRPARIHEAMRYSMKAGGKRLRPTLVLAAAEMAGATLDALPAAVAVECLHTYSLIHDDMPCVDNSDLRRGHPTSHKMFGEAMALLAGDALLTEAFRILSTGYDKAPATGYALTQTLSCAASSQTLIGGQVEDILGEGRNIGKADLDFIHLNKTAALITASLEMGLLHVSPDAESLDAIRRAGRAMGLAFQIIDDILDATSDTASMGKSVGRDAELGKNTYVKLYGIDASRRRAAELTDETLAELDRWASRADYLKTLALDMARRVR